MAKWKNLYCFFPVAFAEEFKKAGILPRRFSSGDLLTVYPSRSQVESAMKGQAKMALAIIDSKKIDSARLVKVDYNHLFYRGIVAPEAFKLAARKNGLSFNPNGKNSLSSIHSPDMNKVRGLTNGGKSKLPSIFKKRRRL